MLNFNNRRKKYGNVHQSYYTPVNPEKWDSSKILFLSNWERLTYIKLDMNPNVIKVIANSLVIPYICSTDNRQHKYFMDVFFTAKHGDETKSYLLEIKPEKQLFPPRQPKKKTAKSVRNFQKECLAYAKNISKWKAAQEMAVRNGYIFQIVTEGGFYSFTGGVPVKVSKLSFF